MHNWLAVAVLTLIHLIGLHAMYGLIFCNGYYSALVKLRDHGPYVLPGSDFPILTKFSGFVPLDKLLTLAGVMFANVTDGSDPQLSLYAFHFAGQLVSIFTVIEIEGCREANRRGFLAFSVIWGCLMQSTGYGFIMPLYSIFHLLASKTAATNDLAQAVAVPDFAALEALPWSLTIGYIIPTILLAIPFQSNMLHQWFGGFWQIFPIWVTLLQHISRYFYAEPEGKRAKDATDRIHKRHVLHNAYLFPFTISAACHLGTLAVVGATQLRFRDIFIPPPFYSCTKMKSMSAGIHNFFQYDQYIGSAAALVWVIALDTNSKRVSLSWRDWILLLIKILALILVAGPGGALTVLMWHRDKRVLSAAEL